MPVCLNKHTRARACAIGVPTTTHFLPDSSREGAFSMPSWLGASSFLRIETRCHNGPELLRLKPRRQRRVYKATP
jgi:hypothetical protein